MGSEMCIRDRLPETQVSLALSPGSIPALSYPISRREEPVHLNKSAWSRPSGWWSHVYWAITLDNDLKVFNPSFWFVYGIALVIVSHAFVTLLGQLVTFTFLDLPEMYLFGFSRPPDPVVCSVCESEPCRCCKDCEEYPCTCPERWPSPEVTSSPERAGRLCSRTPCVMDDTPV